MFSRVQVYTKSCMETCGPPCTINFLSQEYRSTSSELVSMRRQPVRKLNPTTDKILHLRRKRVCCCFCVFESGSQENKRFINKTNCLKQMFTLVFFRQCIKTNVYIIKTCYDCLTVSKGCKERKKSKISGISMVQILHVGLL